MRKFGYGIAFNLTLLEMATQAERAYLGVTTSETKKLLRGKYNVKSDPSLQHPAQYDFITQTVTQGGQETYYAFEKYSVSPILEGQSDTVNIVTAGHEMIHALDYADGTAVQKAMTWAAGIAAPAIGLWATSGTYIEWHKKAALLGGTALTTCLLTNRYFKYRQEMRPYAYQNRLQAYLAQPSLSKDSIAHQREAIKKDYGIGRQCWDMFVKAYPGESKRDLIALTAQDRYLDNAASLGRANRIQDIHGMTNRNLQAGRFEINLLR